MGRAKARVWGQVTILNRMVRWPMSRLQVDEISCGYVQGWGFKGEHSRQIWGTPSRPEWPEQNGPCRRSWDQRGNVQGALWTTMRTLAHTLRREPLRSLGKKSHIIGRAIKRLTLAGCREQSMVGGGTRKEPAGPVKGTKLLAETTSTQSLAWHSLHCEQKPNLPCVILASSYDPAAVSITLLRHTTDAFSCRWQFSHSHSQPDNGGDVDIFAPFSCEGTLLHLPLNSHCLTHRAQFCWWSEWGGGLCFVFASCLD